MKISPILLWQRLSKAAQPPLQPSGAEAAPYGFATRVVARWQAMSREERFRFWRSWSLRAAFAAAIVCGVLAVQQASQPAMAAPASAPQPLQVPAIPLPQP